MIHIVCACDKVCIDRPNVLTKNALVSPTFTFLMQILMSVP